VFTRLAVNSELEQWGSIEQLGFGNAVGPKPAMDAQGRAVVAWAQIAAGGRSDIFSSRFDGTSWRNDKVETDDAFEHLGVQLGMDATGRAFAIWERKDGLRFDVLSNRMDPATGQWGTPELIETEDRGTATSESLAVSADGRAVAAWEQTNGTATPTGVPISSVMANVFK
jgi:hypothetical protein